MIYYIAALILTLQQALDVVSTNLVISKGRGHEGAQFFGLMQKWQSLTGSFWWTIKLPIIAGVWAIAVTNQNVYGCVLLAGLIALYVYVIINNYKIAWRQ